MSRGLLILDLTDFQVEARSYLCVLCSGSTTVVMVSVPCAKEEAHATPARPLLKRAVGNAALVMDVIVAITRWTRVDPRFLCDGCACACAFAEIRSGMCIVATIPHTMHRNAAACAVAPRVKTTRQTKRWLLRCFRRQSVLAPRYCSQTWKIKS